MGTPKQADALVAIIRKIRDAEGKAPATADRLDAYRSRVLAMSLDEVRAEFAKANEMTGFDRSTSPATDNQRAVIARLERVVYGARQTNYKDVMTYAAASLYIEDLQALREAKRAA